MNSILPASSTETMIPCFVLDSTPLQTEKSTGRERSSTRQQGKAGIFCAYCRHLLTKQSEETQISGKYIHFHTNPHGFDFRFACYSNAPGCRVLGFPTDEHSWFPGHTWQLANCAACNEHLGWFFEGEYRFFGLILDRIEVGHPGHT